MFLIHHDFETFSPADIKSAGSFAYLQHPETEILCLSYWLEGDAGPRCFRVGIDPDPVDLLEAVKAGKPLACWNASFETAAWRYLVARQFPHWPRPKLSQFHDIQAWALYHALPPSLAGAGEALGVDFEHLKDRAGGRVMLQLAKPRKRHDDGTYTRWTREDDPAKFDILYEYCNQDVRAEAAIAKVLRPLPNEERRIWLLDQKINHRGIGLDLEAIAGALPVIEHEKKRLDREMAKLTGGAVPSTTANAKLAKWLDGLLPGRDVDSVSKAAVREMLDDPETPDVARQALKLRARAGKSSLAKFGAMQAVAGAGDGAQGAFLYHRASTGRWGGQMVQPQNMPRPKIKARDVDLVVDTLKSDRCSPAGKAEFIRLLWGEPYDILPSTLRGMFVPRRGHEFVGGDFSNIEGRVLAWLAGETWKVQAFAEGRDLYRVAYGKSFGVDPDAVTDDQRQIGKTQELQLGYQGGVGAFVTAQKNAGFSFDDLAKSVYAAADAGKWAEAERKRQFLQVQHRMHDWLPPMVYNALRYLTDSWREANPNIKAFWYDLEECALNAVRFPGEKFSTRNEKITYVAGRHYLFCRLPSGRVLHYARPSLANVYNEIVDRWQTVLEFYSYRKKTATGPTKWQPTQTYGGHLAENVTQAVARDVQAAAMLRVEAAGWPVVLHVHDDIRCGVPAGTVDPSDFERVMCQAPAWAAGLPIACECEVMTRYHK